MFDFAVVMPTVLRGNLLRACRSVVDQTVDGSINIMIGVDHALGDRALLGEAIALAKPPRRTITFIDPGYSTASGRNGVFPCRSGGSLRSVLSFLGNARYTAYLDDDNWFAPDHLETLAKAVAGKDWAFSLRWYVDSRTGEPLAVDRLESTGPGCGAYNREFGGFCDTSTLLIDTEATLDVLPHWSFGVGADGSGVDRRIFQYLRTRPFGATGLATMYYTMQHTDLNHGIRLRWLEREGAKPSRPMPFAQAAAQVRQRHAGRTASSAADSPSNAGKVQAAVAEFARAQMATNILIAGSADPMLGRRLSADGETVVLDTSSLEAAPLDVLRFLREQEALADFSYLGEVAPDTLAPLLSALWGVTKRTGHIIVSLGERGEAAETEAIVGRFAFDRAVPADQLGAASNRHIMLPRY